MPVPKGKRIKLTPEQRATAEGVELVQLLQTITADGRFSADEIVELTRWLRRNTASPVPAVSFLAETVQAIIADGKVTREEQETLYKAVERVLPRGLAEIAEQNRLEIRARHRRAAAAAKVAAREERAAQRERAKAERHLNRKVGHYNVMVAGVRREGRPRRIREHAVEGKEVIVVREPGNPNSPNACRLFLADGMVEIGFVPERSSWGDTPAADLARELDSGCRYRAFIYRVLTEARSPIPVVVVDTYGKRATLPGLRAPFAGSRSPLRTLGKILFFLLAAALAAAAALLKSRG